MMIPLDQNHDQDGITPLTDEELAELIPPTIFTREHLNQWEQMNIQETVTWAFSRKHEPAKLATTQFMI